MLREILTRVIAGVLSGVFTVLILAMLGLVSFL